MPSPAAKPSRAALSIKCQNTVERAVRTAAPANPRHTRARYLRRSYRGMSRPARTVPAIPHNVRTVWVRDISVMEIF